MLCAVCRTPATRGLRLQLQVRRMVQDAKAMYRAEQWHGRVGRVWQGALLGQERTYIRRRKAAGKSGGYRNSMIMSVACRCLPGVAVAAAPLPVQVCFTIWVLAPMLKPTLGFHRIFYCQPLLSLDEGIRAVQGGERSVSWRVWGQSLWCCAGLVHIALAGYFT